MDEQFLKAAYSLILSRAHEIRKVALTIPERDAREIAARQLINEGKILPPATDSAELVREIYSWLSRIMHASPKFAVSKAKKKAYQSQSRYHETAQASKNITATVTLQTDAPNTDLLFELLMNLATLEPKGSRILKMKDEETGKQSAELVQSAAVLLGWKNDGVPHTKSFEVAASGCLIFVKRKG